MTERTNRLTTWTPSGAPGQDACAGKSKKPLLI